MADTRPLHLTIPSHGSSVVTELLLSQDQIISASDDHSILVHCQITGKLLHSLNEHDGGVWALGVTGDTLVSGSTDRTVRVWDLTSGRCTHVFGGHQSTVRCVSIVEPEWIEREDGTREQWPEHPLIVSGSRDFSLRVWRLPQSGDAEYKSPKDDDNNEYSSADVLVAENPYHLIHLEGHNHGVRSIAARGRTAVSGSYDCTVRVWDISNGRTKWVLTGHTQKVYSVVYDPTRHQAYSGSMDGTVRIWNLTAGQCQHTLTGHTSLVGLLSLSPSTLVSASADSTLRIWDPQTGALRHTLHGHTGTITCMHHDEVKVLSGSDGTLTLWDVRNGTRVCDLLSGVIGVWAVAVEGRWCVAASCVGNQTVLNLLDLGAGDDGERWVDKSSSMVL